MAWNSRARLFRERSYYMEKCVDPEYYNQAEEIIMSKGFFENLPPMDGALQALKEMNEMGLKVFICSAPIFTSKYCSQEKIQWIQNHLGDSWFDKIIFCLDKVMEICIQCILL